MPFRRSRRQIIKRDKHEVTWSHLAQDSSAVQRVGLSVGVDVGAKTGPTDCAVGSHIYGIYIEFNLGGQVVTVPKILHWNVVVETQSATAAVPSLYYQPDRSQVLQRGMEMIPIVNSTQTKRIIFVRIPRKWQRQAEGQEIIFQYIASSAETMNLCGFAIYKEIY